MEQILADTALEKATKWAKTSWADTIFSWSERPEQDYAYRQYVVEPQQHYSFKPMPVYDL